MRRSTLSAVLAVAMLGGPTARAIDVAPVCRVPDEILASSVRLDHVRAARAAGRPVRALVIGTGSSAGLGLEANTLSYPARLEHWLRREWGETAITIERRAEAGSTASQMVDRLGALLAGVNPQLVLWQTGTVDAIRGVDLDTFAAALARGIKMADDAGADVVLISPQYGSGALRLRSIDSYLDYLYQIARADDAVLFRRHRIMRYWVESEQMKFDLPSRREQSRIAEQVHDCLAQLLTRVITHQAQ